MRTKTRAIVKQTLWRKRTNPSLGLAIALGGGEVTVAWGEQTQAGKSPPTVRAAYGKLTAPRLRSRAIGHFQESYLLSPKGSLYPQLASAPDGEVAAIAEDCRPLSACSPKQGAVELAWRRPGHDFGRFRRVLGSTLGSMAAFDAAGSAYLFGQCNGRILHTAPGGHRFDRSFVLSNAPASDLTFSLSGPGTGLAAWIGGVCSYDREVEPNQPGPVLYRTISAGKTGPLQSLTPANTQAFYSNAVAVPGGGTSAGSHTRSSRSAQR